MYIYIYTVNIYIYIQTHTHTIYIIYTVSIYIERKIVPLYTVYIFHVPFIIIPKPSMGFHPILAEIILF
jgi:hypothetical protein